MTFVQDGKVNTIFIDPCFPGEYFGDSERFIARIRKEFPNIVFVLYADLDCLERFCSGNPRFQHYFYLDHIWGFQEDSEQYPNAKAVDNILRQCEEWHSTRFQYDVGISFAGEDRKHAEEIAEYLRTSDVSVFYEAYEDADLLGKKLYTHLHRDCSRECRYCVILISQSYAEKVWTSHERMAAQERGLQEREYIIPVRIDNTSLPGLSSVIAYIDIDEGASRIADLVRQKLWVNPKARKSYIGISLY